MRPIDSILRGIDAALAEGADPNAMDDGGRTAIFLLASFTRWEHQDAAADDGIRDPIVVLHVDVVEWLLRHGADDTIQCNEDEHPGSWPSAWDYAINDLNLASPDERDSYERMWKHLRAHRQAPDGTRPDERPDW